MQAIIKNKKLIFSAIMVLIPILFFVLLEFGLRAVDYGQDLKLFQKSTLYPGCYEINSEVGKRYFTKFGATTPTNDIFLVEKPDTSYRVFVLGCSTTRGFPYQSGTTFSRILYYRLQDAFPKKRIEMVNLSMSAINSYSTADMMDEVLAMKPDAIIIYTGHNEYYGALGVGSVENGGNFIWLKKLQLSLIHYKTFQLVQKMVSSIGSIFSSADEESRGSLMERIVKEKSIVYGSDSYKGGVEQFEVNITEVLEKAAKDKVPVILSELVSNVKDQVPFKSEKAEAVPAAIDVYNQAKQLESEGKFEEAKQLYYKAKDYDCIRFRAPEDINNVIIKLGQKFNLPVVPMKSYFEKASPNGLIGDNLMIEHLHPNINGYFLMADAFFNTMKEKNFISSQWDSSLIKPIQYYRNNWGFTEFDSLVGDLKIKMLKNGWPFKPENYVNNFRSTYVPTSYIDTVAFSYVISDKEHIEDKHVMLAKYYAEQGNFNKAFEEYYSLIKCYPYVTDLYISGCEYLVTGKQYAKAAQVLESIPDMPGSNYYYYYLMGKAQVESGAPKKGVANLLLAKELMNTEENILDILKALHTGYSQLKDEKNEQEIKKQILSYEPSFQAVESLRSDPNTSKAQELVDKATELAQNQKFDEALLLLLQSLKIKETSMAYQMIGSIYFQRKDVKAYEYYIKAYTLDPKDENVLNNLFLLCVIKKDYNLANKYLTEIKAVSSDYQKISKLENYLINVLKTQNK